MSGEPQLPALPDQEAHCLNCGALLVGDYCAKCGQHVKHHVHSTWATIREFFEDLFHADHRVWRTLVPLVFRPGLLTLEYLGGRRVRFTPPFRLYIVLSLIFFLVASFDDPFEEPKVTNVVVVPPATNEKEHLSDPAADPEINAMIERLVARVPEKDQQQMRENVIAALKEVPAESVRNAAKSGEMCTAEKLDSGLPWGLGKSPLVLEVCRRVTRADKNFQQELSRHFPQMMFFFLPLIALSGKALYIRPRHYYAEHLLFFVHYHSFFFFSTTVATLFAILCGWLQWLGAGPWTVASATLTTLLTIYVPVYLFLAMRRVYGQGRLLTLAKFAALTVAYLVFLGLTFLGLVVVTALTI